MQEQDRRDAQNHPLPPAALFGVVVGLVESKAVVPFTPSSTKQQ